jgi:uncharacterized membrane protein YobD (UPF0266 family)
MRNSEGAYVLPDDGTWRPKYVGEIDGLKIILTKLLHLLVCSTYAKECTVQECNLLHDVVLFSITILFQRCTELIYLKYAVTGESWSSFKH